MLMDPRDLTAVAALPIVRAFTGHTETKSSCVKELSNIQCDQIWQNFPIWERF